MLSLKAVGDRELLHLDVAPESAQQNYLYKSPNNNYKLPYQLFDWLKSAN